MKNKLHKFQGVLFEVVNGCYVFFKYETTDFIQNIEKCFHDIRKSESFKSKKNGLLIKIGKFIKKKQKELSEIDFKFGYKSLKYKTRYNELRELNKLKKFAQSYEMEPKYHQEIVGDKRITTIWF